MLRHFYYFLFVCSLILVKLYLTSANWTVGFFHGLILLDNGVSCSILHYLLCMHPPITAFFSLVINLLQTFR